MRTVTIYRSIPGYPISSQEFDVIDNLSDNNVLFVVVDSTEIDNKHGWFFAEPIDETRQKVYKSLPADAGIDDVQKVLLSIKRGDNGPHKSGPTGTPKSKDEDILINLGGDGGEYRGLFPIFTIANAPSWLVNLLNTLTGHGKLSLYLWLAISGIIAMKISTQKKRTLICYLILGFSLKMTYDAYRYSQQSKPKSNEP